VLRSYKELTVWQRAYELCLETYRLTAGFPKEEKYGLVSQIRRAAVSVPSNIAEGYGRKSIGEYLQSLHIAYASLCELETQILLAADLGFSDPRRSGLLKEAIGDVERLLKALIRALQRKRTGSETLEP
jgi:four helix bundle protein